MENKGVFHTISVHLFRSKTIENEVLREKGVLNLDKMSKG